MSSKVSTSPTLWYFAYGSNMEHATFVGRRRLEPIGTDAGWLTGYRLAFDIPIGKGERAVANLQADNGARTCGVLYNISIEQAERLDRSEGVHRGLYTRIDVEIDTLNGRTLGAFTYKSSTSKPRRKPSALYMNRLLDGARHHGLPLEYVEYLRGIELAVDERENS